MQMNLKQSHVEAAIRDFVAKAGITFPIEDMTFTAGRGKDGLTVSIELQDPFASLLDQASGEAPAEKVKDQPAAAAVKQAPKSEPKDVATPKAEASAEEAQEEPDAKEEQPPFVPDEEEETPVAEEKPAKTGKSLFGG